MVLNLTCILSIHTIFKHYSLYGNLVILCLDIKILLLLYNYVYRKILLNLHD